jgi:hypothetical protein
VVRRGRKYPPDLTKRGRASQLGPAIFGPIQKLGHSRISKQATAKGTLVATRTWLGMTNNKNHDEKQPGEHPDGKFHYNPGNMAGKKPQDEEQTAENRGETQPEDKPAG